ncbi:TetR/AcrR family transcriptional regulator [Xenorhabdus sp. 12]|uniref:TetR/AcrR family transcriptional regulator n=1 Tax=Xenorhabdus santafensis TaxID=2582833 RepID=A0ABU4SBE2_9GAMM|nr:TetR/AcrR family transcriptional regulator [Xenorhabdus sp. 12]MDX7988114.1 TetR/AcrR family transcriptional regulator [Xenorhabdus sp. 12]
MSGRPREFDDETVIEAAMQVFWSNGYEGSSAQKLCEKTGLGKGSLYNAYGSKQKLYEKALLRYQQLGLEMQLEILNGPGSAKERLRALLLWGIEGDLNDKERRSCMALFAVMERGSKDPAIGKITQAYIKRLEHALHSVFLSGKDSGEITNEQSVSELARAFLSSYYGLRIIGQSIRDRSFLLDIMEGTLAKI